MLMGLAMLAASATFYITGMNEELRIAQENNRVLEHMEIVIRENSENEINYDPYSHEMQKQMINGYEYVGILTIEELSLQLPVMNELDENRLKLAPCLHYGAVNTDDLVIGAHNYKRHFAYLTKLRPGAQIVFTTMDSTVYLYNVASIEIFMPDENLKLTDGEYPLTLFTCTYGGEKRVVVRCIYSE